MEKKYETKNIFLVGLMGAGKTTVGRMLSRRAMLREGMSPASVARFTRLSPGEVEALKI